MSGFKPWEAILPIAALAAPFVAPALFGGAAAGEAAAGAGEAAVAGAGEAAAASPSAFLLPGTETAIAGGIPGTFAFPEGLAAGAGLGEVAGTVAAGASGFPGALAAPEVTGVAPAIAPPAIPAAPSLPAATPSAAAPVGGAGVGAAGGAVPPGILPEAAATGTLGPAPGVTDVNMMAFGSDPTAVGGGDFPGELSAASTGNVSGAASESGGVPGTVTRFDTAGNVLSTNPLATPPGLLGTVGNFAAEHPFQLAGLGLTGGGLLYNMLNQPKFPSVQSSLGPLQAQAANLGTQGTSLAGYLQSGTLPAGVQTSLDRAANEAKASIRSKYAAMGGGAETSTAALQEIAAVDQRKAAQGADIAMQLLSQGVSEEQLSSALYQSLLQTTLSQSQAMGQAISNFAGSLVPRTYIPATSAG